MFAKQICGVLAGLTASVMIAVAPQAAAETAFNPEDFYVVENPGQYIVYNLSSLGEAWYIYAFGVTNPLAGSDIEGPSTTRQNWDAFTEICVECENGLDASSFEYSTFVDSIDPVTETPVRNPFLIGPGASSGQFFFFAPMASTFRIDLIDSEGATRSVTGPARAAIPEPSSWALMIVGFGLLGSAIRQRRARSVANAV